MQSIRRTDSRQTRTDRDSTSAHQRTEKTGSRRHPLADDPRVARLQKQLNVRFVKDGQLPPAIQNAARWERTLYKDLVILALFAPLAAPLAVLAATLKVSESWLSKRFADWKARGLVVSKQVCKGGPNCYDFFDELGKQRHPDKFAELTGGLVPQYETSCTPVQEGGGVSHYIEPRVRNLEGEIDSASAAIFSPLQTKTPPTNQDCLPSQADVAIAKLEADYSSEVKAAGVAIAQAATAPAEVVATNSVPPIAQAEDPNADVKSMTDEQLLRELDKLKASPDRRSPRTLRIAAMSGCLNERQNPTPVVARPQPQASSPPTRPKFPAVLDVITPTASPETVDAAGLSLGEYFREPQPCRRKHWRKFIEAFRLGIIKRAVMMEAIRVARGDGADRPAAVFTAHIDDHTPGFKEFRKGGRA
jgi:hypothetical protein